MSGYPVKPEGGIGRPVAAVLLGLIRFYQVAVSPLLGANCRYRPTCSAYAVTAIKKYGPLRGTLMASRRIARCNPFHPGGYDPVP